MSPRLCLALLACLALAACHVRGRDRGDDDPIVRTDAGDDETRDAGDDVPDAGENDTPDAGPDDQTPDAGPDPRCDCGPGATCDEQTGECLCSAGAHLCGNTCVPNTSVLSCGDRCDPCPVPLNAQASCDGAACGFVCNPGYHRCGDRCLPDSSPASCGTSCEACPMPWNGASTCDGLMCGVSCNPGYHRCGSECLSDTSPQSCGASCSPCFAPENGRATCDGFNCGIECNAGYARCGSSCVPEEATRCGATCRTCPTTGLPANARAACSQGECTFECETGFLKKDGACHRPEKIAAGGSSSCALLSGGRVKCWSNDVAISTTGWSQISVGDGHACALRSGALVCWGGDSYGQLGDGASTPANGSTPVSPTGMTSGVAQVSAGGQHTCAVTTAGSLKCWGRGLWGRLGNGSETGSNTPVTIYPTGVQQVAAGGDHTCALLTNGTVQCWGYNHYGQVGVKPENTRDCGTGFFDPYCRSTPETVPNLTNVVAIGAGTNHTCALVQGGQLKCWGNNVRGQLGVWPGTSPCSNDRCDKPFNARTNVASFALGEQATCIITTGGALECFGFNHEGQMATGSTGQWTVNTIFSSGVTSVGIGPGGSHVCALVGGVAKCWGYNGYRQLGDGTTTRRTSPIDVWGR